ncbi:MAG: rluA [Verrucomicrobia bacterium]|jgi:RluA family pseudouridine synthase|nr:rluA [Verrucomicrobiota bacterium]
MAVITNISTYQFAELSDLKSLREKLRAQCNACGLKGTILLSTEGINMFVAGARVDIDELVASLRAIPGLETLTPKYSESEHQPFSRMLVRIKKEIIAFGVEGINPARRTSPKLTAKELKQWLDEGRPVTLLDTRNDYEVKLGTFRNALPIGIDQFRQFPDAVRQLPASMKEQPIVMFCTGGIRCEKAGPFMEREGFSKIYQLDGGILKYFEECGGDHYDGECFVFDQRVGVDPALRETEATQCFNCLTPLTEADQEDPRYVPSKSCPYCFKTSEQQMAENIAQRHAAIRKATTPLPGSIAYDNYRPVSVPVTCDGLTVLDFLCTILDHISREEWLSALSQGRILNNLRLPVTAEHIVRTGERYLHLLPAITEPDVNADIRILHEDEAIIVLEKPAPLPLHPSGRYNRNTLQSILHTVYHPQKPRPGHRLDANTSGVVVFTRTRHFAGKLQPQFARGEVEKIYLVKALGHPSEDSFFCDAPISTEPGEVGNREVDEINGLPSRTEFKTLARLADGTSLLEARPLTGRTNQIRVHLWELGFPICGDQVYLPGKKLGDVQTITLEDQPLCLHAWKLSFKHPLTHKRVTFETEKPEWSRMNYNP